MLRTIYLNYSTLIGLLVEKERSTKSNENYVERVTCISKVQIKELVAFLKLFKDITQDIEGDKYVTLHYVIPPFEKIKKHLDYNTTDLPFIDDMKTLGRKYMEKVDREIQPTMTHKLALFLHPLLKGMKKITAIDKLQIHAHVQILIDKEINKMNSQEAPPDVVELILYYR